MSFFTNHRLLIVAVIVLAVLNIGTLTSLWFAAKGSHIRSDNRQSPGIEKFLDRELDLTKTQRKQFRELRERHFDSVRDMNDNLQQQRKLLYDQLYLTDSKGVQPMVQSIAQRHADLELANYQHFEALRVILDDRQKSKFDRMINGILKRSDHRRRDRRQGPRRGPSFKQ